MQICRVAWKLYSQNRGNGGVALIALSLNLLEARVSRFETHFGMTLYFVILMRGVHSKALGTIWPGDSPEAMALSYT